MACIFSLSSIAVSSCRLTARQQHLPFVLGGCSRPSTYVYRGTANQPLRDRYRDVLFGRQMYCFAIPSRVGSWRVSYS
jgi:hypothetical protein